MNNRSRLGYSRNSPYKEDRVNQIGGSAIDMTETDQPIVGTDGDTAVVMQPGSAHQFNGPVTETTLNNLEEMEADLLEAHLSTLSEEDQEEFVEKYEQLEDNMRLTALTQMFRKHKDKIKYQAGGFTYTPSTDFLPAGYVLTDVINKDPTELNTVMEGKPQSESKPAKTSQLQSTAKRQIKSKTMPAVVQPKTEPSNLPLELRMEKFLSPPPKTPSPEWFGAKRNTILDNLSDAELLDSYQAKVDANIKDPMLYQEMAKRNLLNSNASVPVSTTTSLVDTLTNKLVFLGRQPTRPTVNQTIDYDRTPTVFVDSTLSRRFQSLGKYSTREDMGLREVLFDPAQSVFLRRNDIGKYIKIQEDEVKAKYPSAYEKVYGAGTSGIPKETPKPIKRGTTINRLKFTGLK